MTTEAAARPWPVELRVRRDEQTLDIRFDTGETFSLPAEFLRVMTPSAADRGHGAGPGRLVTGKQGVGLSDVRPIGRYAVRIAFDDGHDTGLYSWDELYRLGREQPGLWAGYLARLASEGQSRRLGL
jgi:DUF971 family protein